MKKTTLALGGLLAAAAMQATAQPWPSKPIDLIVPFAPGGTADTVSRLIAPRLAEEFKQPVVVQNKPGAGGNVGTAQYSKAPADGYTLIEGYVGTISINPGLYGAKLPYNPEKDLVAIAPFMTLPMFLVVNPTVPAKTLAEYVALAKSKPGAITFASAGNGGSNHLAGELLKSMAAIDMRHVPYNGSAPGLNAVLGGHVASMFDSGLVLAHVKSGKLNVLAVSTAKRLPAYPDIPAVSETYPGFEAVSWHGLFAPAGTPKPVVDRLNAAIGRAIAEPEIRQRLAAAALEPFILGADDFALFVRAETAKWDAVVKRSGAKVD